MGEDAAAQELAELLRGRLGAVLYAPVDIAGLHQLSGGASRQTWAFEARPGAGSPQRLVLRRDPPGHGRPEAMAWEAAVIQAAEAADVPVPRLIDHSIDDTVLGAPYVLTSHVDGETIPRRLLREPEFEPARATMARELGRVAARIHRIPPSAVPGLPRHDPLEHLMARYEELCEPLPSLEVGLRWLDKHRPAGVEDTVVHGDFRNGNLIVDPTGLRAVLDWERVHRGDPREDLGWLCVKAWRFASSLPVGGFGTRDELLDGYAEVAGATPDPDAVHWWEVYGTAWWAVGCRGQAERHLSGETRSVELAAVGRRVCEQEHDLLLALGVAPPPAAESAESAESAEGTAGGGQPAEPGMHGRPSMRELVEAVGEFLRSEVQPTGGRLGFHGRVAANVLDIVERELLLGEQQERSHRDRLATLGMPDDAALAAAIRSGAVDPADPAVIGAVRADVTDRLTVANPRYLSHPA
ncbi:MAG: phosphotransferase [Pseudonocardiaceae bacterium]|nr:phosphotransferase [Pseudonocardiaceae bacterium]